MKNNRKTAAFITALAMIITAANINGGRTIEAKDEIIYGDLNSDSIVDVTDLSILSLYLIGDQNFENDELKEAADVEYDHSVDIGDLACLRSFISKKRENIGKETAPADSTKMTVNADTSELKDITRQCITFDIDNYYNNMKCAIYSNFIMNHGDYGNDYTAMISTKKEYDECIGCYEMAADAFEKAGITVGDDFFENKRIVIEMNQQEVNGMGQKLTAVKTDSDGNVNLYFDRYNPGTMTCLASYYYNVVIVPDNPHNNSKASSHYNTIDMFSEGTGIAFT
ncbi:dockerin type I repeat-containing protein [Ruminococcus sp. HUN007]|uniref:dockerin type I repeat-containing protein n=1 Tax=Ruminococcus sp. HUN007 TaxID=1514668 RepID=UPI0005D2460C|nr:dockerin type I repeat-containing protein [Ruminococcus sp. HUN007]